MLSRLSSRKFAQSLFLAFVLITFITQVKSQSLQYERGDFMFGNASLKMVFTVLAGQMKMSLIFDSSVKDASIQFEHKDILLREAFDKLLEQEKLASLSLDRNIILIFQNTPEIARRVQEATIWTIADLMPAKTKQELISNEDWLKMLKESGRKDGLRSYNLKNESLQTVITKLAGDLNYLPMFDESVKNTRLDLMLHSVTPVKGIETVFSSQKLRARILDERTIIVFAETADRYEKLASWTAILRSEN